MRKLSTILLIILGFCGMAAAQQKNDFEFGVNAGLNISYVHDSNITEHAHTLTGFNAGISAERYFFDSWSLKAKVIYDEKGWTNGYLDGNNGPEVDKVTLKLNYITVPVMVNWHFGRSKNWYAELGPYIGFLHNANAGGSYVNDDFNSEDAGVSMGLGFKLPVTERIKFFVEYEGQYGLTGNLKETNNGSAIQNIRGSFNVGVNF